jgi:hypothetical protein
MVRARTGASQIPSAVATAIKTCWPNGVVEEFATDESYFHDTRPRLERDLRNIRGASLLWETEEDDSSGWDEDANGIPRAREDWQSYYMFFLAPDGKAFVPFRIRDGRDGRAAEDTEEAEWIETTDQGKGWIGCAVGICLAAPYAVINLSRFSRDATGTMTAPDVDSFVYSDKTHERVDTEEYHRQILSQQALQKLQALSAKIVTILAKHRIQVLDKSVLNLRVPGLKASEEVFLEEPLRVRDALFFRGV